MLITLVIIGVVAALTIPNLMQKYTEQTTVKKVQKFYSTLSNAYSLATKDNGNMNEWGLTGLNSVSAEKVYKILFQPYFKIAKDCGVDNTGKCISDNTYVFLNNTTYNTFGSNSAYYKILLEDGSAVLWRIAADTQSLAILYDVNGKGNPNKLGMDTFEFDLTTTHNKLLPGGLPEYSGKNYFTAQCKPSYYGYGCTAWLIYKGNMDYLHCNDLSWNGKDKCK